jgi:hypothetical protein
MKIRMALAMLLLPAIAIAGHCDDKKASASSETGKSCGLDAFKQLAGEWQGKAVHGSGAPEDVRAIYKVTSGGNTVLETIFPGTEHEMISVIHRDGDELVLKHYCMLDNQPEMRASNQLGDKQVAFKFARATNLKSEGDMHMHNATFTFVDNDTLKSEWTHYQGGKASGTVAIELKRVKK